MNRTLQTAVAAALGLAAMPLLADENQGFYAGGGVGRYDVRIASANELGSVLSSYSSNDTAYKLFVGWRWFKYLAIEGSYINLGTFEANPAPGFHTSSRIDGWAPSLVGTLPLGPIELFVSGGEYWYNYRYFVSSPLGASASSSSTLNHFIYSGGVGVNLIDHIPIRLEYQRFDIQQTDHSNALWLTAAYRF